MHSFTISSMKTEEEINGKACAHYQSWQETYAGLVDTAYLNKLTQQGNRTSMDGHMAFVLMKRNSKYALKRPIRNTE